jgi:hypothetical protein
VGLAPQEDMTEPFCFPAGTLSEDGLVCGCRPIFQRQWTDKGGNGSWKESISNIFKTLTLFLGSFSFLLIPLSLNALKSGAVVIASIVGSNTRRCFWSNRYAPCNPVFSTKKYFVIKADIARQGYVNEVLCSCNWSNQSPMD